LERHGIEGRFLHHCFPPYASSFVNTEGLLLFPHRQVWQGHSPSWDFKGHKLLARLWSTEAEASPLNTASTAPTVSTILKTQAWKTNRLICCSWGFKNCNLQTTCFRILLGATWASPQAYWVRMGS
jgi:hypothetical protein